MDKKLANEIIACLPKDRTLYRYYEDQYAADLLVAVIGDGLPIASIRASRFARLLDRPRIKEIIARKGDGMLTPDDLYWAADPDPATYVLTLGLWGSERKAERYWNQTSRTGLNLVLQLNFCGEHDQAYRSLLRPGDFDPFVVEQHPVSRKGRNTLAWARMDIEMDLGEALIEEIQNDWLRFASNQLDHLLGDEPGQGANTEVICVGGDNWIPRADAERYMRDVLEQHRRIWSQAMLAAAIWFLREEIGISRIWYHDYDTGARLKNITLTRPPRSLYTDLPKRFCFQRTVEAPEFIVPDAPKKLRRRLQNGQEKFWHLAL